MKSCHQMSLNVTLLMCYDVYIESRRNNGLAFTRQAINRLSVALAACAFAYFYVFYKHPFRHSRASSPSARLLFGRLEQRRVRKAHNLEVVGSSPTPATNGMSPFFVYLLKIMQKYLGSSRGISVVGRLYSQQRIDNHSEE